MRARSGLGLSWRRSCGIVPLAMSQPAAAQVDDSYHPPAGGGGGGFDDQIRRQGGVPPGPPRRTSVQRPRRGRCSPGGSVAAARQAAAAKVFAARSARARWRLFRSPFRRSWATIRSYRADISRVVASDLERSGLFQPLDPASFLEIVRDVNALAALPRLATDQRRRTGGWQVARAATGI